MKKCILITISLLAMVLCYAQSDPCSKYEGRPMPDWIMGATPEPLNHTYYYKVFEGASEDREEARNMAIKKAFQQAMTFLSVGVSTEDIFAEIDRGGSINVISESFSIPIYFTCEFSKKTPDGQKWVYWMLCQIAVRGNIVPQFDTHFSDCNAHDIWDKQKEDCQKERKIAQKSENTKALFASMFIPGAGQMMKKQGGKGAAFLISELVLFGGSTACYFLGQDQIKIMKSTESSYDDYKNAKKLKNTYDIAMYVGFGVGAAVHITNMVHAYVAKDKRNQSLTFAPAIIPANEYTRPTYAYGVGLQYKF